jgi:hypothetical protein
MNTLVTVLTGTGAVVALGAAAALSVIVGVALPAVWFSDEQRRRDARAVLDQLLTRTRRGHQ